jgi:hypothetical protein
VSQSVRLLQWWAGTKSKRTPPTCVDSHQSSSTTSVKPRRVNQEPRFAGTRTGVSLGSLRTVGQSRWS